MRQESNRAVLVYGLGLTVAAVVLVADYASGPFIQFPIFYLIPIAILAWYAGWRFALVLAIVMSLARLYYNLALWDAPWSGFQAGINALIRIAAFGLFAILIDRLARQQRALEREIKVLQGFLPICGHCKSIRGEDGSWYPLESYISNHSEARFTHSICPSCEQKHYAAPSDKRQAR